MSTDSEHRPTLDAQDPPEQLHRPDSPDSPDSPDPLDSTDSPDSSDPEADDAVLLPREAEPEPVRDDVPVPSEPAGTVQDPSPPDVAPEPVIPTPDAGTTGVVDTADRWRELQGRFVDDPAAAVQEAADLVEAAIEQLRGSLPGRNAGDTEELRQAFQRYRAVHEALTRA